MLHSVLVSDGTVSSHRFEPLKAQVINSLGYYLVQGGHYRGL